MSKVLLFSLTAMANPSLVAATTVMLLLDNPKQLMLGYLLGAWTTSITIGLVIVFALQDSGAVNTAKDTVNPAVDFAIGGILLLLAFVLGTGRDQGARQRRRERKAKKPDKGPPRWRRELEKGSPRATFLVGAALSLPGASYLAALQNVVKLEPGTGGSVLLVLLINLIMLALLEVPLLSFALAPDWTPQALERTKGLFARHGYRMAIAGLATLGTLLATRGLITFIS
jgi:Sap, sulfolipid-1-addressing protein